jgi:hypothetical protein
MPQTPAGPEDEPSGPGDHCDGCGSKNISGLAAVLSVFARYLPLDPGAIKASFATVVANRLEGEPVWSFLVSSSSRGKTEVIRSVERVRGCYPVSKITEPALLPATTKESRANGSEGGILSRVGARGIVTMRDFSPVLALPSEARSGVFAAFRDLYDGCYTRDVGLEGGQRHEWRGKLGMIAGVTSAIDQHHEATASLGERWVYYRLPVGDDEEQAQWALDTVGREAGMRAAISTAVVAFLDGLDLTVAPVLSDADETFLKHLVVLAVRCRSSVDRDSRTREINSVPDPEGPGRLTRVLAQLHKGFTLIGNDPADTRHLLTKIALDGMPPNRQRVVRLLAWIDSQLETKTVAMAISLPEQTTRRALEDLTAHGVLERSGDGQGVAARWALSSWARRHWNAIHEDETSP